MMNKKLIPIVMIAVLLPIVGVVGFSMYGDVNSNGNLANDHVLDYGKTISSYDEVNYGKTVSPEDGKITSRVYGIHGNESPIQLVELADLILLGDVKSVSVVEEEDYDTARWKMVFTYYEIEPTEILKGTPILNENGYVLLRISGGETEDYETVSDGLRFSENDHVFMYLGFHDDDENPIYIPTSESTMFIVRGDEAMKYVPPHGSEILDTSDMLDEHKALIESLE